MRIIKPSVEVIPNINIPSYEMVERVGRICYKSEDRISEGTAVKFVSAMHNNKHYAMLEHSHVIFQFEYKLVMETFLQELKVWSVTSHRNLSSYLNITSLQTSGASAYFVSGSLRAWIELMDIVYYDCFIKFSRPKVTACLNNLLSNKYPELFVFDPTVTDDTMDSSYASICEWDNFISCVNKLSVDHTIRDSILMHHIPITCVFTCDLLAHRELVRHRPASFAGESTRYCNYSNHKFNNEITVVTPTTFTDETSAIYKYWVESCERAESTYFKLLDLGVLPQEARSVLPVSTKSDLAMTCTESEWKHVLDLRLRGTTGKPHPQIKYLMELAYPTLVQLSNGRLEE